MSIVPPRLEGVEIPQTITVKQAALTGLVSMLSALACENLKRTVEYISNTGSYGAINVEFDLEVLRVVESRLDEMIEDLATELKESGLDGRGE